MVYVVLFSIIRPVVSLLQHVMAIDETMSTSTCNIQKHLFTFVYSSDQVKLLSDGNTFFVGIIHVRKWFH